MKPNKIFSFINYLIAVVMAIIGFASLPFGLLFIVAAVILVFYTIKTEKQLAKNKTEISTLQEDLSKIKESLNDPMFIKYSEDKAVRDEFKNKINEAEKDLKDLADKHNKAVQENNEIIDRLHKKREELTEGVEKLEKKQKTAQNKLNKLVEIYKSMEYATETYYNSDQFKDGFALSDSVMQDVEELNPSVILKLHSMDIKDLHKAFRKNDKDIESVLAAYIGRYTTKSNKCIYQLMVIALRSELQNILTDLKYEKLDAAVEKVQAMTSKYLAIAGEGNQNIAGTLTKFIGQVEYLFINAVKIEYNYYVKKEQARQEQLAIREQMRLEAQERKALEEEKKKIEKEEAKYNDEIEKVKLQLASANEEEMKTLNAKIAELQAQLSGVVLKKDEIIKLQNGKAGNIYIISNLGSFGEDVFKIGMTRRADPQERVNELGDASVPFRFDVHSFIFSDDAVELENKLHTTLNEKRVNKVNRRKEFFRISLDELEELVTSIDPTAEFNKTMAAEEFRQSISTDEVYSSDYITDSSEDDEE